MVDWRCRDVTEYGALVVCPERHIFMAGRKTPYGATTNGRLFHIVGSLDIPIELEVRDARVEEACYV